MDRSSVRDVVERELDGLMCRLGIGHWQIRVSYAPGAVDSEGVLTRGECTRLADYQSAHISLNPEAFDDASEVLVTLRHELFHVVLAPLDLYTTAVERVDLPDAAAEILGRLREHVLERAVIGLERMYAGLTS